ncbi:hypothetical protein AVEN_189147-1 [Araneus ventricosus]|uniref:Uncharacterized protein n=1 Tax=Araneus ventricosus TaxID=182803 RepID=A0A4Y2TBA1_ARAVE|nr:hypothetical protein AVEN_189147-1 [Araneus ventricosus]
MQAVPTCQYLITFPPSPSCWKFYSIVPLCLKFHSIIPPLTEILFYCPLFRKFHSIVPLCRKLHSIVPLCRKFHSCPRPSAFLLAVDDEGFQLMTDDEIIVQVRKPNSDYNNSESDEDETIETFKTSNSDAFECFAK